MLKILVLIFVSITSFAQTHNADSILNEVKQKFETVKDYTVELNIEVDMEFLRIPNTTAKAYFKQPDKMKIESNDFAVLPKEGMNFSPAKLLNNKYSAIYVKSDVFNNTNVDVIKVIPLEDSVGIILSTFWIDSKEKIIRKIETTTKDRGTFQIELFYENMKKYGLPNKMEFTFSVNKAKLPQQLNNTGLFKKPAEKLSKNFKGKIVIKYSNYKINQNLKDSFFKKEK